MFASERLSKIKEILIEYKHVDVNTLCSLLDCSLATVRRDLDKLEADGFLVREHGGAILNSSADEYSIQLQAEEDPYKEDKRSVAEIGLSLVQDYDSIFIGPGYTTCEFARMLAFKKGLTVVTNSLAAANTLSAIPGFNCTLLGGTMESNNNTYPYTVGNFALSQLSNMYIQKAFFTVNGVSMDFGYSINSMNLADLFRSVLSHAEQHYIFADSSKFDKKSMIRLCGLTDIKNIITNVEVRDDYKSFFFSNNVAIYTSFNSKDL